MSNSLATSWSWSDDDGCLNANMAAGTLPPPASIFMTEVKETKNLNKLKPCQCFYAQSSCSINQWYVLQLTISFCNTNDHDDVFLLPMIPLVGEDLGAKTGSLVQSLHNAQSAVWACPIINKKKNRRKLASYTRASLFSKRRQQCQKKLVRICVYYYYR